MARLGPLVRSDLSPFYRRPSPRTASWDEDDAAAGQTALALARNGLTALEREKAAEYLRGRRQREEWIWQWQSWMYHP